MLRGVLAIFLAIAAGTTAYAAETLTPAQTKLYERLKIVWAKAQGNDCQASLTALEGALDEPAFAALPDSGRSDVYKLAAICAYRVQDKALAYRYALAGTQIKTADAAQWALRLSLEAEDKRYEAFVTTLEAMAVHSPTALNALSSQWSGRLYRDLKQTGQTALRARLLAVLTAPSYQSDEVLTTGDAFKRDYAAILVDAGKKAEAAALVARIVTPSDLIEVSVDPRLRTMLPADFDGRAATEQRLAQLREIAASHPGLLAAMVEISQQLRQLGRAEEAVATLEAARPDGPLGKSFTDLGEYQTWWWDALAYSYQALGRYDDAVAAFRKGIDAKEYAALNVSQTINLAAAQLRFGHPADALATVATFEKDKYSASPYGEMQLHVVRGCARMKLGQSAAARDDVAFITAHTRDAAGVLTSMLLCSGDMDGAAAAVIKDLGDPDNRQQALLLLSDYDPRPPHYPVSPEDVRLPELKARADVKAAIARAGGTRHFHLQN
jgi:tetratricopeptide (TPR) repeat protein